MLAPAVAADAVDEACARAFARWERVQAMRSPAGWVYRVAVNEARRQLRRGPREADVLASARGALVATGPAPPPGGEAWLLVDGLPPRQRAAVVLRHAAGLTEGEVGELLGVTRSTVSSALADAHRTLAARLAAERPWPFRLAVAVACGTSGCEVTDVPDDRTRSVRYSDAVRDVVKVRPGDLVAVAGDEVVWRWWRGDVDDVTDTDRGTRAVVGRRVTQRAPGDPARGSCVVRLPAELSPTVRTGDRVWFGGSEPTVVASATAVPVPGAVVAHSAAFREAVAVRDRTFRTSSGKAEPTG